MKPVVAIVGRPNVGKSTLFNRITRSRDALVDNMPGVTRDRHFKPVSWQDREFILVDTGGFITGDDDAFAGPIRHQVDQALAEADAVVLLLDGKSGVSPFDRDLIDQVRRLSQPVFFVVNKIDGAEQETHLSDFYSLGLEHLYSLSAEHGYGVNDFMDALIETLPTDTAQDEPDTIRVAVVGRPNVGKSSLVNRLVGQQRLVVSDVPGTTRDAIDTACRVGDRTYTLVDTAGIRRKAKVDLKLEKFSVIKALKSLERCDVALIVIDAHAGVTDQDIKVAGYAYDRGCGSIFVLNKWDLVDKSSHPVRRMSEQVRLAAKFLAFAPIMTISALTGQRVHRVFKEIDKVYGQYTRRIGTGQLNRVIGGAVQHNEPSLHKGKRLKFYYSSQVSTRPPTFVSFVNYPQAVHFSYQRYLINQIRSQTGLDQVPVRLIFRQRTGKINFKRKSRR